MTDYYLKYKEYKKKYLQLEKHLDNKFKNINAMDFGGIELKSESDNNTRILLNNIIKKLNDKGYVYWLTNEGKVITKDIDEDIAQKALQNKIKKNKDKYDGQIVIKVQYVVIDKTNPSLLDGSAGPIKMGIYVHKINFEGKNISLAPTKDFNDLRFHYFKNDLVKFKLNDMKKFSVELLNKKDSIDSLKFYTFQEIKKLLK